MIVCRWMVMKAFWRPWVLITQKHNHKVQLETVENRAVGNRAVGIEPFENRAVGIYTS